MPPLRPSPVGSRAGVPSVRSATRPTARPSARDRLDVDAIVAVAPPTAFRVSPDGRSVAYLDEIGGAVQLCLRPLRGGTRRQLTACASDVSDPRWSPDGTRLAYVRDKAIWVIDADGGRTTRVADHPAGNEAPCWAPDGERLAFLSRRRGWSQLWLADVPRPGRGRPPSVERLPEAHRLTDAPCDLSHPAFSPDGRWILCATMCSDDLTTEQLVLIDASGQREPRTVAGDSSIAVGGSWWPDGGSIVYVDDRDGWFQVRRMVIDPESGAPGEDVALTSGPQEHGSPSGDPPSSPQASPDGRHVAHVIIHDGIQDLAVTEVPSGRRRGGARSGTVVSPEPGLWRIMGWAGPDHLVAIGETNVRPQDLWLLPVPGLAARTARARMLTDSLPGALPVHRFASAERVRFTARDGLTVEGILWRPTESDGSPGGRRVPIVIDSHGGPTSQRFRSWWPFYQLMVQEGMAVLTVDFRGSSGYGRAFRLANVGEWGHADTFDLIDAAHWASAQPWADGRLAILGGSYGGYMTLTCLVEEPGLWRAGVDLYGDSEIAESYRHGDRPGRRDLERMMGKPDDPERAPAYRRGSPVYRAERIEAPLLILHGRQDARVVPLMSERMIEALKIEGKHHEVHWYEGEAHGWRRRENRRDAYARILAFLKRHLLDEEASGTNGLAAPAAERA
jgi:dipeptidyl aminopeptidase/acylaminoacyl peptidase